MHVASLRKMVNIHCLGDDLEAGKLVLREMERVTRTRDDPEWQGQTTGAGSLRSQQDVLKDRLAVVWSGLVLFMREGDAEYAGRWSDELLIVANEAMRNVARNRPDGEDSPAEAGAPAGPVDVAASEEDEASLWMGLAHVGGALAACLAQRAAASGQELGPAWAGVDVVAAVEEHAVQGGSVLLRLACTPLEPAASLVNALLDAARADAAEVADRSDAELAYSATSYFSPSHRAAGETARAGLASGAYGDAWMWMEPVTRAVEAGLLADSPAASQKGGVDAAASIADDAEAAAIASDRNPDTGDKTLSFLNPVSLDGARIAAIVGAELALTQLRTGADPSAGMQLPEAAAREQRRDGAGAGAGDETNSKEEKEETEAASSVPEGMMPIEDEPGTGLVSAVEAAGTALRCADAANSWTEVGPGGLPVRIALGESAVESLLGTVLRAVAEVQHRQDKAVTAEGLLRSAAAHTAAAHTRAARSDKSVADAACRVQYSLARLTADWDKREADSEGFARAAAQMRPAVAPPAIVLALDWGFCGDGW